MKIALVHDDQVDLGPLTDLRASFELRSGAVTSLQRIDRQLHECVGRGVDALFVSARLAGLVAARQHLPVNQIDDSADWLVISGRCTAVEAKLIHTWQQAANSSAWVDASGALVAARLDGQAVARFLDADCAIEAVDCQTVRLSADQTPWLISRPWHLLDRASEHLVDDLQHATAMQPLADAQQSGVTVLGDHPVRVGKGAVIDPMVLLDAREGPITLDADSHVHGMSVIEGPAYLGAGSIVMAHGHLRGRTIIGPVCKIGGEVGGSVFQGLANKAHFGYVGDSYIGQWVNLGAGTTTSNLKNTYGPIAMQFSGEQARLDTGRQYLGSIVGDHVKTAIGTRLMTGSCIGTGALIACSTHAPRFVERFAFVTDQPPQRYALEKFCIVAERVMGRRGQTVTSELTAVLADLHNRCG
jgi:UDP-N-acetylglucosamine diphosphorylase/glucosamine-1-phosphate N-acetyltransferase